MGEHMGSIAMVERSRPSLWLWALLPLLVLSGCGTKAPPTGKVSGTVTFKGKALPEGVITFINDGEGRTANAAIKDGQYTVPNAPVGPCGIEVTVSAGHVSAQAKAAMNTRLEDALRRAREHGAKVPDSPMAQSAPQEKSQAVPIPKRYGRAKTSGLAFTVAEGAQSFDVELKP
jgi:hypothetical protein